MHFRVRKNVVQLIRGVYDPEKKKGVAQVVGSVRLDNPLLDEALRNELTPEEVEAFEHWLLKRQRTELLRSELAALTLAEQMDSAARWFRQQKDHDSATALAHELQTAWQNLRRSLTQAGLL